jgi:hypothetical protein
MQGSRTEKYRSGTVGYFTSRLPYDPSGTNERGHIIIDADGTIRAITLDEDLMRTIGETQIPSEINLAGATEHGGVLMLDMSGVGFSSNVGGVSHASVRRYRSSNAIFGLDATKAVDARLMRLEVQFFAVDRWTGFSSSIERYTTDDAGHAKTWSVRVESPPDQSVRTRGRTISVGMDWQVSGRSDQRTVGTPSVFRIVPTSAATAHDLIFPIRCIQELLSVAYNGFVVATSATAVGNGQTSSAEMWIRDLMKVPSTAAEPSSADAFPIFTMAELGGIQALSRWVRLRELHPRATGPVVTATRSHLPVESNLLSICAGIEYWVASHRRVAKWASDKLWPRALANRVGARFGSWVGNQQEWCDSLWSTYNQLKHDPSSTFDSGRVYLLGESARVLLTCALLDRVAGSKTPSRRLLEDHRLQSLGARVSRDIGHG